MTLKNNDITAIILAGGMGRRMGGLDKGLIEYDNRLLIEILIEKLEKQGLNIVINANRNQAVYESYGYPVISDNLQDYQGPLAGFSSAMSQVKKGFILTLPCDSPFLREDFVERFVLAQNTSQAPICVAHDGDRLQPVHALINTSLVEDLNRFLDTGERKIDRWYALHNFAQVDFSDDINMFKNINTPEDKQSLLGISEST